MSDCFCLITRGLHKAYTYMSRYRNLLLHSVKSVSYNL